MAGKREKDREGGRPSGRRVMAKGSTRRSGSRLSSRFRACGRSSSAQGRCRAGEAARTALLLGLDDGVVVVQEGGVQVRELARLPAGHHCRPSGHGAEGFEEVEGGIR